MNNVKNQVYSTLRKLDSLDNLTELFCSHLNYQYSGDVVSQRDWKPQIVNSIRNLRLVATHDDFHIIFCGIDELLLGIERPIVNQILKQHPYALMIFSDTLYQDWHFVNVKYDDEIKNRRLFRRIVIGPDERLHTAAQRISLMDVADEGITALDLQKKHDEAFDVEAVTKEFHKDYKELFNNTVAEIRGRESHENAYSFTHLLFNRLMFLYFIQRKGWLKAIEGNGYDIEFMHNLWLYYQSNSKKLDSFYQDWLKPLFFEAFKNRFTFNRNLPSELLPVYMKMPFLNGGLFMEDEKVDYLDFQIKDEVFERLLSQKGLLQRYNFTVREDLPLDMEVALDHDMLGTVYESVVNEDERGSSGMFYTPRTEVDFMCRLSLIEYLNQFRILKENDLIELVVNADYPEEIPYLEGSSLKQIRDKLRVVKIVDPACGSGAFLVGMLKVISGLIQTIHQRLNEPLNILIERRRIIGQNLYGVDVKSWAVKICELRLWLTLVVEADDLELDIKREPLLPNLDYNIRQGDSLVEEIIPGRQLVIRGWYSDSYLSPQIKSQITHIQKLKSDYFENRAGVSKHLIEQKKYQFINSFFIEEQKKIQQELVRLRRSSFEPTKQESFGFLEKSEQIDLDLREDKTGFERRITELEERLKDYRKMEGELKIHGPREYFLWDLDFAEIFYQNRGFDIVIGNPPYVRQEGIAPPNKFAETYSADRWREVKKDYKEKLIRSIRLHWPGIKEDRKCDLYVYFYIHGLALLKPGGAFCFITSNSWLDVGYGRVLQQLLLEEIEIRAIFDNQARRSFSSADINTVISLFRRPDKGISQHSSPKREGHLARFVTFKKPFEACLTTDNLIAIFEENKIVTTDDYRIYPITQGDLFQEGVEKTEQETMLKGKMSGKYTGGKWGGKYLRAPDIFYTILEKGKDKLTAIQPHIGKVITVAWSRKGLNSEILIPKSEGDSAKYETLPVLKSPREIGKIIFGKNDTETLLVLIKGIKRELKHAKLLWVDIRGDRHLCHYNTHNLYFTHNFHGIVPNDDSMSTILCGLLNSTLTAFFVEVLGRKGLGGGAVRLLVEDLGRAEIIVAPSLLQKKQRNKIEELMDTELGKRRINSVFEELRVNPAHPVREQKPNPLPDRKAIDDIVFDILSLTEDERNEVYWSVCELVKNRLEKARSV
jgi:hypothetical protein